MGQVVYSPKLNEVARQLALQGMTNAEITTTLQISNGTFYNWCKEYPDFKAAILEGKDIYDSEVVEKALLEDAIGKEFEEVTIERDPNGDMVESKVVKKWQRNFQAQRFWLMNRHPSRWKDKQELELSSSDLEKKLAEAEKRLQELRSKHEQQKEVGTTDHT
jgi:transposase